MVGTSVGRRRVVSVWAVVVGEVGEGMRIGWVWVGTHHRELRVGLWVAEGWMALLIVLGGWVRGRVNSWVRPEQLEEEVRN